MRCFALAPLWPVASELSRLGARPARQRPGVTRCSEFGAESASSRSLLRTTLPGGRSLLRLYANRWVNSPPLAKADFALWPDRLPKCARKRHFENPMRCAPLVPAAPIDNDRGSLQLFGRKGSKLAFVTPPPQSFSHALLGCLRNFHFISEISVDCSLSSLVHRLITTVCWMIARAIPAETRLRFTFKH